MGAALSLFRILLTKVVTSLSKLALQKRRQAAALQGRLYCEGASLPKRRQAAALQGRLYCEGASLPKRRQAAALQGVASRVFRRTSNWLQSRAQVSAW